MWKRLFGAIARWFSRPRAAPVLALPEPEPDLARRKLLRGSVFGVVTATGLVELGRTAAAAGEPAAPVPAPATQVPHVPGTKRKHRWGMAIDLDRCTACGACTVACREENNVPVLGPGDGNDGARPEWMSLLWRESDNVAGLPEILPFPCQHCEDAPCTKVCPVGATFIDSDGLVAQIYDRCIGCRYCMVACPYGRRSFNWREPEWDGNLVQLLNPDVATRPKGVVEKCSFCHHRVQKVKEDAAVAGREVVDDDVRHLTACAAACPSKAITFGDLLDQNSDVSRQHRDPRGFRLLEHLGTKPAVVYLKRDRRSQ
jgi:molybdopterin-containing oxidoreductase family iron-sulfur binding subunit